VRSLLATPRNRGPLAPCYGDKGCNRSRVCSLLANHNNGAEGPVVVGEKGNLLCLFSPRFARREQTRELTRHEQYTKRMMVMYSLLIACFIGIFICVAIPHATLRAELGSNPAYTVYAVAAFGILLGFNTMVSIQMWSRVRYPNENYVLPSHMVAEHQEPLLNPQTIEVNSHVEIKGKDLHTMFTAYTTGMDKINDLSRRRVVGKMTPSLPPCRAKLEFTNVNT
jgi:hypothetical protein